MKNTYFMTKKLMNEQQFANLIYKMVNKSLNKLNERKSHQDRSEWIAKQSELIQKHDEATTKEERRKYSLELEKIGAFDEGGMLEKFQRPSERGHKNDKKDSGEKSKVSKSNNSKESSGSGTENETEKERKIRISVEKQLQRPGIDIAPYAYSLDDLSLNPKNGDDNKHKTSRSELYKELNHKPDSNGKPKYLSPERAIKLKNELSGNLAENRKNKLSESHNKIRLSETDLIHMVTESVKKIIREYEDKDLDSFSKEYIKSMGNWKKENPYLEDPKGPRYLYDYPSENTPEELKKLDNNYSWDLFDENPIYPESIGGVIDKDKLPKDIDNILNRHKNKAEWSSGELGSGQRTMQNWVKGEGDIGDIAMSRDYWDDIAKS